MTITPNESDLHTWLITLAGPANSPYAGGTFNLTLTLPPNYPFKAPTVNFQTRIYHPNVTNDSVGSICLALIKDSEWKPASRIKGVLEAVRHLLVQPNPDDPLEERIAREYKESRAEFDKNAQSYVQRYASAKR
ncbi:ubiquitin-conjugating enzyme [Xylariaceae sp. FL1272]|nr:ubiquitin-conjugating enzyme [Xylariaceae sp. FL1272]